METSINQRWRDRRDSYRPAGEVIETARYEVAPIARDTVAKAFVAAHHYSGTYPAARFRFGLYRGGELVGVAVFSVPCQARVLTSVFPDLEVSAAVELGRFVLLDEVPGNGETWFLARAFELLRLESIEGVVSFSDPMPRATADGAVVFPGHYGGIYQAHNAVYLGRTTVRSLRMLPNGAVLSARAISKIRAGERGWRYAAAQIEAQGAPPAPEDAAARRTWLARALDGYTRTVRHPGNHRYAWPLGRGVRRMLPAGEPYPKLRRAA